MLQFGYVSMCACVGVGVGVGVGVCVIVDGVEHTHTVVSGFCYSRCAVRKEMNERKCVRLREKERERERCTRGICTYIHVQCT